MNGWRVLKLSDVAEVATGNPAPQQQRDFAANGAAFVRMQDVGRFHHTKSLTETADKLADDTASRCRLRLFPRGTLLIPKSGASVNLNHRALLGIDAYVVSHLATVIPDTRVVDPEYLYYWSLTYDPRHQAQTTSLPSLPISLVKAAPIPVPPLDEQRRIVDLLSRAEGIVRLRREAQKKAQAIIPALFLDMFGDPATNPKGWPLSTLGEVGRLDRGRSRHRPRDAAELYGGSFPFIQTGDVANSGGRIVSYSATYSEAGLAQSKLWPKGTLCITIAANIAKTGVLTFDACFPDSVVGFIPSEVVATTYIQVWLSFLQPTLELLAPQAAQKNINLETLRALPVPVPPTDLQRQFAELCDRLLALAAVQRESLAASQRCVDSLLRRSLSASYSSSIAQVARSPQLV